MTAPLKDGEDKAPGLAVLAELRPALLELHKTLLEWERVAYERAHGRQSPGELLQLLLTHPQFNWLHGISELVVRIDEAMELEPPMPPAEIRALVEGIRATIGLRDVLSPFGQRYQAALQDSPDAVFAHKRVQTLLKRKETY